MPLITVRCSYRALRHLSMRNAQSSYEILNNHLIFIAMPQNTVHLI